ncbi:hypothetical protein [Bosea sp. ANAM02]|uniref:hypothetical protein n=1 Tax=Bosea sp. ANAM02 TaxID=2020412 RepID=UPI00140ECEC6|nr:hypothetical protein [Bosea sp. ANAM02]BCB17663.1 hypothetical protein OCUBac02_05570 [Bosea sp. ANAM02]
MKLSRIQIQEIGLKLLSESPGGIRWVEILTAIKQQSPETPHNSIQGAIHNMLTSNPDIIKVARGTYQLSVKNDAESQDAILAEKVEAEKIVSILAAGNKIVNFVEADFYQSFADWLKDTAEEVSEAVVIGGNILKGKWGTPDVIGILKPDFSYFLKFEPQIVTAEIKIDPSQPVVAFGQAIAYRLFSHKSYIVMPETIGEDDLSRLKALCSIHGVGLVLYKLDKDNPEYRTVITPALASPDMFYANQAITRLHAADPAAFKRLFG